MDSISVVIPTHNRLDFLKIAIESVRNQSLKPDEIIVVDDGSTDGTCEWLNTEGCPDITIAQGNNGVSHARNRGIEAASGVWIAFLDSDDYWYQHKLQRQMDKLGQDPSKRFCHCDEHWMRHGRRVNQKRKHQKYGGNIFEHCLPLCAISPSATIIKKALFDEVGLFDESLPACEDYDLWLRLTCTESVLYVDEPLLVKTGGHNDQLSQRYPAMDRFRVYALAKLIRSDTLDNQQLALARQTLASKLHIYCQGAIKRGNHEQAVRFFDDYADLI
ncbi:MAG: glycosyltransferase [Granulosicoccus sp.]|nr:glycosyltransferase [Granulosicoccus sp.]